MIDERALLIWCVKTAIIEDKHDNYDHGYANAAMDVAERFGLGDKLLHLLAKKNKKTPIYYQEHYYQ